MRVLTERANQRGLWVAVFGPDGVGKSAVIKQLAQELSLSVSRDPTISFPADVSTAGKGLTAGHATARKASARRR